MNDRADNPVFDKADFLDRVEGDMELAGQIVELFSQDSDENIARMRTAIAEKDWQALSALAHSLKGASANLSGLRVSSAAYELEIAAKNCEAQRSRDLLVRLEQELSSLQEVLKLQIL